MSKVSFGLIYDSRNPSRTNWSQHHEATLEQIAWVDASLPFDGIRVTEHHFYEDGYLPTPLLFLAEIVARTKRMTIGTNLNPVAVAPSGSCC